MKILFRVFFFLIVPVCAYATPVTHIYFAEKWLEKFGADYGDEERQEFVVGVVFPDIHFLNIRMPVEPESNNVTVTQILDAESPFEAGRLFHYYFARVKQSILTELTLLENLEGVPPDHRELLLMLLEDHMYFDEIDKVWARACFNDVVEEEEYTGVPYHTLRTWHRVVRQYFGMSPYSIVLRLRDYNQAVFGAPKETVAEWSREFLPLLESDLFQVYIATLEDRFEDQLTNPID